MADELAEHLTRASPGEWQAPGPGRNPLSWLGICLVGGIALVWFGITALLAGVGTDCVVAVGQALGIQGGAVLVAAALSLGLATMLRLDRRTEAARRAERRAAEARDLLSAVLNAFPGGMQIKDRDLRFVWVNDAHRIPIHFSPSDLLGRTVGELDLDPALAREITDADRRVLETGQTVGPVEQLLLGPDGKQKISILVTRAPLIQQGVVTHVITFAVETTASRRQTCVQLDETRRLLETIMDAAPITILMADRDMRISRANRAFIDAFDLGQPLIGKTLAEAIPNPGLVPEIIAVNEELFEGRRTLVRSEQYFPATAERPEQHWLAIKVPVRGASGKIEQVLTFGTDITALKRAEAEAEWANRLLAGVLDNVPLTIQVKDRDLRYRWANRAFVAAMAMDPSTVPGKAVADIRFSPETEGRFEAMDRAVLETGETIRFDDRWVDQGVEHVISVIKAPILDNDGRATHVLTIGDDVTEQQRLRLEAQTANRLVEGILRNAPLSIQVKDAALRYRWVNRKFADLLDRTPEELVGLAARELPVPTDAAARTEDYDRTVLETRETLRFNERWIVNGNCHHVMVVKAPLLDSDDRVTHVITIGADVSELHLLRAEAEEARRRLQQVLDAVPVTIALKDRDRRFVWVNREFERVLAALNVPTVVGLRAEEVIPDEALASSVERADEALLETGQEVAPVPERLPGDGGEIRDYSVRRVPVRDATGAIEGILVVGIDVTDLIRVTNELRQVNAHLEQRALERARELAQVNELVSAVLQSAPMPIVTFDLRGGYTSWNPAAEMLTGYSAAEALGGVMPPWPPSQRRALADLLEKIAHGESFSNVEITRTCKGGGDVELLVSGAPLRNADGTIEGAVAIGLDMTELRATARQLQQIQKMEAVGQLTGGIAHDFNNLLAVIIGALDLLALEIPAEGSGQSLVQQAIDAAERGADLTSHLLAFARRQSLRPIATDVGILVREISPLLHRTIGEAVKIRQMREPGLWPALVDRAQLESAILNLVVNARDAMSSGGTISIDIRNVTLDREAAEATPDSVPGDYVAIAVSDTGHGIPLDIQCRVFEPFFTTKPVGQGTGLGLSMVLGFVKQSGGHLVLTSAPEQGTSVTLYLPRAQETTERPVAHATSGSAHGETILLVEDDPEVRRMSAATLAALGYPVVTAAGVAEALAALEACPDVALLLSDIILGSAGTGFDLAREVRRRRPELPVLFVSGFADPALAAQNPLDGPFDILLKPFRREQLEAKLRAALGSVARDAAG